MNTTEKKEGGLRLKGITKSSKPGLPLITIITVVYNDQDGLEETMKRIVNQSYSNFEYLVIDGGSTDGTLGIIKKYEDKIDYWLSEKDQGLYYAMNKGIDLARGEWINFMSSGDHFYNENVLKDIFSNQDNYADLIYGSFVGIINNEKVFTEAFADATVDAYKGMRMCWMALFIKAEIYRQKKLDTNYRVAADGDIVAYCIKEKKQFKKVAVTVFEVGKLGFSHNNATRAFKENWQVARKYFPSIKTDLYHLWVFTYWKLFLLLKKLTPIWLYNYFRDLYRKYLKEKISYKRYGYKFNIDK